MAASLFVIGGGGREHSLAWHTRTLEPHAQIYCAPGNPGIARIADCLPIPINDLSALAAAARDLRADLTIVGPEAPLVAGIADVFAALGMSIMGPSSAAAALEGSKVFAKDLMRRYGVPTARHTAFRELIPALTHLDAVGGPIVVKADGLAAGKGVIVCDEPDQARRAVRAMLAEGTFGDAGREIVIEERLAGDEVSVFALVDGEAVALLPSAQDHKRIGDGDRGPNTGGMGAAAPYILTAPLRRRILREILEPVAAAMCAEGRPYRGILFAGLMLTTDGPKVLEFNCRLGDPEAQVILPLLPMALSDAFDALRAGRLGAETLAQPGTGAAVGIVLASRGYPASPDVGFPIDGLDLAVEDALVFHSGTAIKNGRLVTAGGRVLTVVGRGSTVQEAQARAYRAASRVQFEGLHCRRDIGARLLHAPAPAGRG
jgi:phosphoribosylamine--glycine ligase